MNSLEYVLLYFQSRKSIHQFNNSRIWQLANLFFISPPKSLPIIIMPRTFDGQHRNKKRKEKNTSFISKFYDRSHKKKIEKNKSKTQPGQVSAEAVSKPVRWRWWEWIWALVWEWECVCGMGSSAERQAAAASAMLTTSIKRN